MMKGFKDFLMRGNLVEMAVAFIMAAAFGAVVSAFTEVVMGFIGLLGGQPNFDQVSLFGVTVGPFLTALVSFVAVAAILYFFVVKPYSALKANLDKQEDEDASAEVTTDDLLVEIRDLLKNKN